MDRQEYKRQNEQRDSKRKHKFIWRQFWKWHPAFLEAVSDRIAAAIAAFTFVLAVVGSCQLNEMQKAYGPAQTSANAALRAVETTRQQISAYLSIPNDPQSTVKIDLANNFKVILDLYVANVGQSVAHDTYFDLRLTINGPASG
jgi:hypothetical protein